MKTVGPDWRKRYVLLWGMDSGQPESKPTPGRQQEPKTELEPNPESVIRKFSYCDIWDRYLRMGKLRQILVLSLPETVKTQSDSHFLVHQVSCRQ